MPLMKQKLRVLIILFFGLTAFIRPYPSYSKDNAYDLLQKHIMDYNLKTVEESITDSSYRGEEGILGIKPEVADSLGMKVYMDEDYRESMRLFKEAEEHLEEATKAMAARNGGRSSGNHVKKIADHFLSFKSKSEAAQSKMVIYRSKLHPPIDDRLDKTKSGLIMKKILEDSFHQTGNKLRDGLAFFYNICRGADEDGFPLTTDNVGFVNYVFNRFLSEASESEMGLFDLDRDNGKGKARLSDNWKGVADSNISEYVTSLETAIKKHGAEIYTVDPLLYLALIRKESDFNPLAVSSVGAAGLTQIMPRTAKHMGMQNIYMPEYYLKAESLLKKERETRREAMSALYGIDEKNSLKQAKEAWTLMQRSLELGRERATLLSRYRRDLLSKGTDDRLHPEMAIEYGLRFFAKLMRDQEGDISLALASYNAGPHRVKQYKGIPPYDETVGFRNRILKYYREYLSMVESNP